MVKPNMILTQYGIERQINVNFDAVVWFRAELIGGENVTVIQTLTGTLQVTQSFETINNALGAWNHPINEEF